MQVGKCPECGSLPFIVANLDGHTLIAVRFRCECGRCEMIVPFGLSIPALAEKWNEIINGS